MHVKVEFEVRRLVFALFNEVKRRHTGRTAISSSSGNVALATARCGIESKGQQIVLRSNAWLLSFLGSSHMDTADISIFPDILGKIRFISDQTLFLHCFPASKRRMNISIVCTGPRERAAGHLVESALDRWP